MNLPSPKILYPFANVKEEFILADYGPNNLHLQKQNDDVKIVSNNMNRFGLPDHSITIHGGDHFALLQPDVSSVIDGLTQFSILLQFNDFGGRSFDPRGVLFINAWSGPDIVYLNFQSSGKLVLKYVFFALEQRKNN